MKFRTGLIVGIAVGYVAGTKAGRERYEQIVAFYNKLKTNDKLLGAVSLAESSTRDVRSAAGRGMVSVADTVRSKTIR